MKYEILTLGLIIAGMSVILFPILNVQTYTYEARVSATTQKTSIGIATDADGLDFGAVPVGYTSIRYLLFENRENIPARISIESYGNISNFLNFNNEWKLGPHERIEVPISIKPKIPGNFTGEVLVKIRRGLI